VYHFIEKRKLSLESHKLKFIALSSSSAESIKFMAFYCEAAEKYKKNLFLLHLAAIMSPVQRHFSASKKSFYGDIRDYYFFILLNTTAQGEAKSS
jgi:hypothetical protein